jgi:hypothetical protein
MQELEQQVVTWFKPVHAVPWGPVPSFPCKTWYGYQVQKPEVAGAVTVHTLEQQVVVWVATVHVVPRAPVPVAPPVTQTVHSGEAPVQ